MSPVSLLLFLALAKANGIATTSCSGCHGGGNAPPTVALTAPQASIAPGQTVMLTLTIGGGVANGGFYVTTGGVGTFVAGGGTRLLVAGLSHSAPRAASGGTVTFTIAWTAPMTPGGTELDVGVLGGNGDNRSSGDRAGFTRLSLAWGCAATPYYLDLDRDGHGNALGGQRLRCAPVAGLAALSDDCDDNDERVFPTAIEACNLRDDNCNGQIDDGLQSTTTWPDRDGDGFGDRNGTTQTGCTTSGRAANSSDCNDADAKAFPGGVEICNGRDDDCDSNVDDGVRIRCGVGWCARFGPTCDPMYCMPGEPRAEECNAFDDDCDGVADNGQPCGAGQTCFEGQCYASDMPLPVDAGSTPDPMPTGCQTVPAFPLVAWVLAVTWRRRVRHEPLRRA